jgi:HlyD family secretion protein
LRNRLEAARATLGSTEARLTKLLAGSRPEEIREAEAAVQQAQFDMENKEKAHQRMKSLYERGVIAKESYDNAETAFKMAQAGVRRASENYRIVREGARKEDIQDAGHRWNRPARPSGWLRPPGGSGRWRASAVLHRSGCLPVS